MQKLKTFEYDSGIRYVWNLGRGQSSYRTLTISLHTGASNSSVDQIRMLVGGREPKYFANIGHAARIDDCGHYL